MNSVPAVSVIMNCYNSERYLAEAIDSIYAQTFDDWEIIFWDNASTDGSESIAKSYDNKLRYFRGDVNVSLGQARNFALGKVRGKFVCFLDCDDWWLPEKLEKQIELFGVRKEIDFLYTNYFVFDEENNTKKQFLRGMQPEGMVFEPFLYNYPVGMLTVMLRKTCLDELDSLFDESLYLMEEFDVFMRVLFNRKAAYLPEISAVYRVHKQMNSYMQRDKWGDEMGYLANKFLNMGDSYLCLKAYEIMTWKKIYSEALLELIKKNSKSARKKIAPFKFEKMKGLIVYLISFLPGSSSIIKLLTSKSVYLR